MRALTDIEKFLISSIAEKLPKQQRLQILDDLSNARVESEFDRSSIVVLKIAGYERPRNDALRPFAVEGHAKDTDGAEIEVILHGDENGRVFQLELVRYAEGEIVEPDWKSLNVR